MNPEVSVAAASAGATGAAVQGSVLVERSISRAQKIQLDSLQRQLQACVWTHTPAPARTVVLDDRTGQGAEDGCACCGAASRGALTLRGLQGGGSDLPGPDGLLSLVRMHAQQEMESVLAERRALQQRVASLSVQHEAHVRAPRICPKKRLAQEHPCPRHSDAAAATGLSACLICTACT